MAKCCGRFCLPTRLKPSAPTLRGAAEQLRIAIDVADGVMARHADPLLEGERQLWSYGMETLAGLDEYLAARAGNQPASRGKAALDAMRNALRRMREIQADLKGTWGAFDLERFHPVWMELLRGRLEVPPIVYDF